MTKPHVAPTEAQATALMRRGVTGPIVMLNLLRFRDQADYRAAPQLAPEKPISGEAAFDHYFAHTLPHLEASGGRVLFMGDAGAFFIGPTDEHWHRVMLIQQVSVAAFLAWAGHEAYLDGIGHRSAALEDSRLLPIAPRQLG